MSLQDYASHELMPRKLTEEENKNPLLVIENFFDYSHLPQARDMLWELLKTLVTGNYSALSQNDQLNLFYFLEQIEKLIEGSHLMLRKKEG
ncbi:MAG TPA: hypothetical protein VFZ42_15105 [Chitinophagaceae bacterium]